jgi:4-diphosphocytidyl-2-C-methyl-D-erythritol kinase
MSEKTRVTIPAPGKINLFLEITGTLPNGYHKLNTVMHTFLPGDTVTVELAPHTDIRVTCSRPGIPRDSGNIAYKTAEAFFAVMGISRRGLSINIEKLIPQEAGLGGGSADAAAVLRGLNELFGTRLDENALCEIGVKVGADVPFCVVGGCALAQGIGEKLTPLPPLRDCHIAIAKPKSEGVSTPEAYRLYDEYEGAIPNANLADMLAGIRDGNLADIGKAMHNAFEHVMPGAETNRIKAAMRKAGAGGAVLSGTGSAVAGLFADESAAKACLESLADCETLLAKPVGARIARPLDRTM